MAVGCPIYKRGWILPSWFEHVAAACDNAGLLPEFVFVASKDDQETVEIIKEHAFKLRRPADIILVDEPERSEARQWNLDRYGHMVILRNRLLNRVRQIGPNVFWSLDSDILPAPDALKMALPHLEDYAAVGMRCFMEPTGTTCASHAQIVNGTLRSRDDVPGGVFRVDVIMAAKLMTPSAYWVNYEMHAQGEDIGWSLACAHTGLRLGWCGSSSAKHVMAPNLLDVVDKRIGF